MGVQDSITETTSGGNRSQERQCAAASGPPVLFWERAKAVEGDVSKKRVEIRNNHTWEPVSGLESIRKGDLFRMFEPDGTLVKTIQGGSIQRACIDGFLNEDGVESIQAEGFDTDGHAVLWAGDLW